MQTGKFIGVIVICSKPALMFRGEIDAFSFSMVSPRCEIAFIDRYLEFDYLPQVFFLWGSRSTKPISLEDCLAVMYA